MTEREVMLNTFEHKDCSEVPYQFSAEPSVTQRMDEYYGTTEWRNKLKQFIVIPHYFDTKVEVQIDDIHARDMYGSIWRMDKRPWHLETPALENPSFTGYKFPSADEFLEPLEKNKTKEKIAESINNTPDKYHIESMGWGIFEHTWRIRGYENALMDSIVEVDFYEELVGRLSEIYLNFVRYFSDVKVDAIMFGDDWGEQRGVVLGKERWKRIIKPAWSKVYDEVHRQNKRVISHSCGSVADIFPDLIEMGLDMLESVQPEAADMNPYQLKKKYGDKICFYGALGSQSIIPFGTPSEIKAEIKHLKTEMASNGGYILSPAKELQPETPTENAVAIFEAFIDNKR